MKGLLPVASPSLVAAEPITVSRNPLAEAQGEVDHARNAGEVPTVIYVSTLLETGEPAAIPD